LYKLVKTSFELARCSGFPSGGHAIVATICSFEFVSVEFTKNELM